VAKPLAARDQLGLLGLVGRRGVDLGQLELEQVQRRVQADRLRRYMGKTVRVLAERTSTKSADDLSGHSTCHKVVNFRGSRDMIGSILDVRILEIKSNSLYGEVC